MSPRTPLAMAAAIALILASLTLLAATQPVPTTLAFSSIFVVNLAARTDRRARMDTLARALNLNFTFLDAVPADSLAVQHIMQHVREERTREGWCGYADGCKGHRKPPRPGHHRRVAHEFRTLGKGWSEDSLFMPDVFFYQHDPQAAPLGIAGADTWPDEPLQLTHSSGNLPIPALNGTNRADVDHLKHKRKRDGILPYNVRPRFAVQPSYPLPWWRIVSPAAVACWHSHVQALKRFVKSGEATALILEDDVDIESDIADRMTNITAVVPNDWDLIALGHCWSREDAFAPIDADSPSLRPANAPKCNHAYSVSRSGAMKLLRHLRSPAFAYSRPFDQALVHLIVTERINAYSIVPSVIVQTKDTPSDIVSGNGSKWRDRLQHGVLDSLAKEAESMLLYRM